MKQQPSPTLESLLQEMIAQQQTLIAAVAELSDRLDALKHFSDGSAAGGDTAARLSTGDPEAEADFLYEAACEVINGQDTISAADLEDELEISSAVAGILLARLEADEIIGAAESDGTHPVVSAGRSAVIHGD